MLYGSLQRAYIGVAVAEMTEELAEQKGIDGLSGVYVVELYANSGAHKAGIKKGDVLLSINDMPVDTRSQLTGVVAQYRPGDKVNVKLMRDGKEIVKKVTLVNMYGDEELIK